MELHPLVEAALDALDARYEVLACDPGFADTAAFCEHYGVDRSDSANTIVVVSKKPVGAAAACVALSDTRLDVNHRVRQEMGVRKLSFARAEETVSLTDMMIGGVTPFGLPADMPILIDARVLEREQIVLGGGNRTSKLRLKPRLLLGLSGARVVEGLASDIGDV